MRHAIANRWLICTLQSNRWSKLSRGTGGTCVPRVPGGPWEPKCWTVRRLRTCLMYLCVTDSILSTKNYIALVSGTTPGALLRRRPSRLTNLAEVLAKGPSEQLIGQSLRKTVCTRMRACICRFPAQVKLPWLSSA